MSDPVVLEPPASASVSMSLPPANPPTEAPPPAPPAPSFAVPDAYKEKPYLKGVDSLDKVFSMLDGAQTLIGKKSIPGADAKPEDWEAFYDAKGRPKTAAEYKIEGAEKSDPRFLSSVQKALHKIGATPSEANLLWKEVSAELDAISKEKGLVDQQADIDFEALASKTFGVNKETILSTSKGLLEKFAPSEMKPLIANLPNEQLILLAGVLDNINKTYIKQDGAPSGQPAATGRTPGEIQEQARQLMLKPEFSNPFLPGHDAVKKQVEQLYQSMYPKK